MADVCLQKQLKREGILRSLQFVTHGESLMIAGLEVAPNSDLRVFVPDPMSLMVWENVNHQLYWCALDRTTSRITLLLLPLYADKLEQVIRRWHGEQS